MKKQNMHKSLIINHYTNKKMYTKIKVKKIQNGFQKWILCIRKKENNLIGFKNCLKNQ